MNGQVEESLTLNFKIIRQGHVIPFNIFEFCDLNLVENDTNLIVLSHLHQKISRLTNNGKNSVFWPPSCTYDVMTYVTWQRQDDVTYAKMCLPSLVTDTMRRFLRLESSKKLQGKMPGGWYPPPLGVRGLNDKNCQHENSEKCKLAVDDNEDGIESLQPYFVFSWISQCLFDWLFI